MGQDIDRVFIVHQGVEAVAGGVLDLVLVANALCQSGIGACGGAQARQFAHQRCVALAKAGHADRVFGVEHRAVTQHHPHARHGAVAVLRCTATHARGIVGGNAADLAGVDGGRVGTDFSAMRRQTVIDFATDHAGAHPHGGRIGRNVAGGKTLADQGQHAIRHCLPGEAGARCAEGDRSGVCARRLQQSLHLCLGFNDGHHLGREPVETGVRAICQAAQVVGDDLRWRQNPRNGLDQGTHFFLSLSRSRRRLGAGMRGVRLRVQAPCSVGDRARPRLMNHEVRRYRPSRL